MIEEWKFKNSGKYVEVFAGKFLDKRLIFKINLACQQFHTKVFDLITAVTKKFIAKAMICTSNKMMHMKNITSCAANNMGSVRDSIAACLNCQDIPR